MKENVAFLRHEMEKELDPKRFEHTLGVSYTSACLAMCNHVIPMEAEVAGLLHDCAKCLTNEERITICQQNQLVINEAEEKNPFLLHAKVGAHLANTKYNIHDEGILQAIRFHTTGRPHMTEIEKIVFVADYIEPGRTHSTRLPELRKLAFRYLDEALVEILKDTLQYLQTIDSEIDPMTKMTYEYYINQKKK